jgi:mono/diheme cytochrome c family protein
MNAYPLLPRLLTIAFGAFALTAPAARAAVAFPADAAAAFTDRHCSSCHNDVDKEAGLDVTSLQFDPKDPVNFALWVKIHDRVQNGEMPPKEKKRPAAGELGGFVQGVASSLIAVEQESERANGRAMRRRLNRNEYENALRDLLGAPWLQIKDQLPEDGEAFKFNKVSNALDVSYVHMTRYMLAAEYAMRQAMGVKLVQPETKTTRYYARDDGALTGNLATQRFDREKFPVLGYQAQPEVRASAENVREEGEADKPRVPWTVGESDPATRELEAVGWTSSNYVTGFASGWTNFRAPVAGRYRIRFSGYTVWVGPNGTSRTIQGMPGKKKLVVRPPLWFRPNFDDVQPGRRYEPITVYAQGGPMNRRLGGFDVKPEPSLSQLDEVWLLANEYIVTDASRFFRSRPTGFQGGYTNALAQKDGMPAVAFRWMEVEGPLYDESSLQGYRQLFGDLPLQKVEAGQPGVDVDVVSARGARGGRGPGANRGAGAVSGLNKARVEVVPVNRDQDAERLLRAFMQRAYRRPVAEADVQLFLGLIKQRFDAGLGFAGAMLAGYTAVLSSPQFVFVDEQPGRLDDNALATRLALFLWNSEPDAVLRARAAKGELHRPEVLKAETDRMLADPKSARFAQAFLDYWIEIRRMDETTPSTTLYNDYYLDDSLTEAALDETRLYFQELVRRNLPARHIVDSDFTYLNDRLAVHYGIPGVEGVAMRRVTLPADSPRGGFMTQASVLKVTANGTTTSPVLRGKWIMERIVGYEMPLPPASVPAVEPDIRGATTIRQQLDKHRADESCAMCHRKIDPPGFALENFDVMGGWRTQYRAMAVDHAPHPGFGKNGWPFAFYFGLPVDASGSLNDGRAFKDVRDFKQLLLKDEAQLARNLTRQLSVFATGAPVRFNDRARIEAIVQKARGTQYGVRTLIDELIQSELFLNK